MAEGNGGFANGGWRMLQF